MDTSENHNTHQKAGTLISKRNSKEYLSWNPHTNFSLTYCEKKYDNKKYLIFLCCFHSKDHPRCPTWTLDFEPAFSPRFYSTLSPRSIFQTAQRFLLQNHVTSGLGDVTSGSGHVTSGCLSPRSFSPPDQRFPPSVTTQPHNQSQLRTGGVYAN